MSGMLEAGHEIIATSVKVGLALNVIRHATKKALGFIFRGIPSVRHEVGRGLTVFVFHDVSDCPSPFADQYSLSVSTATFRILAIWIKRNFNVIRPRDLLDGKVVPEKSAIISFDDGFLGTFQHGLPILEELGLPSVIFLNMQAVLEHEPLLSATACYLDKNVPSFLAFAQEVGLERPFHVTLSPSVMRNYESRHGPVDRAAVLAYQGQFVDIETLKAWDGHELVAYGNHLFQHWNACALNSSQFEQQFVENEKALALFKNRLNLFAFTNGQPGTCWTARDVALLLHLGAGRVFSSSGRVNRNSRDYVLDRFGMCENDVDENHFWFRIGRTWLNNSS